MDSFAIGLKVAQKLLDDQIIENVVNNRYSSYTHGIGLNIVEEKTNFHKLEEHALDLKEINQQSGQLERIKAVINQYLLTIYSDQ